MLHIAPSQLDTAADLDADLAAVADGLPPQQFALAVTTTPSILRRLAARIAPEVPPGIDRVCASGPADSALATAVSLRTGVPVALVGDEGVALGELHRGERIVVVSVLGGAEALEVGASLSRLGVEVDGILAAVGGVG